MSKDFDLEYILKGDAKNSGYSRFAFNGDDKMCKVELFNASCGVRYIKSEILCNAPLSRRHEEGNEYSCLFFNNAKTPLFYKINKSCLTLKRNEFWLCSISNDFSGVKECFSDHYAGQSLIINKALLAEIKAFDGLNYKDGIAIENGKINFAQQLILSELTNSKIYSGKLQELFMEAKILELLCCTFTQNSIQNDNNLCDDDIKTLQKAKRILLSDIQNPPSIKELARLCATNDFKLKSDFKRYFGTTIYGMLQDERLSVAKELLRSNDISVKEAAKSVGYASAPHFAKIFREKFSILPTQLSKKKSYHTAS